MKNSTLSAVVAVALLVLAGPGISAGKGSSDAGFQCMLTQAAQDQSPPVGIWTPAPTPRVCHISRPCGDGNTAMCTGNSSCVNSQKGVKCDGVETACPNYCELNWNCSECSPPFPAFCWSLSGDCGVTNEGCNGSTMECPCLD